MQIEQKQKIEAIFESSSLCVIATMGEHKPEAALIGFSYIPDTLELIFGTFENFRKYKNLQKNNKVAFVIGWEDAKTVQYEGMAAELSGQELLEKEKIYLQKFPKSKKYLDHKEEKFFKVTPSWLRYRDLSAKPEELFEINFNDEI